jgi:NADP-dependent 3-hydroxy acid dehydrogenase YdfG
MNGTVVVITGASAGIGAATARLLGGQGVSLALVARRKELLDAVAAESGDHALPIVADAAERADNRRVVQETLAHFGHIDVWINNVGRGISIAPSKLTDEDIDEMIRLNVKTALYGMQEVLPHFRERGRGHVINVSSLLGRVPFATIRSAYCGAKHFLNALTATFRAEVQETHPDIQFSLVSPGVVRTDFGLSARHGGPDSRSFPESQSAEEVAGVIAGVITTRRTDVYTRAGMRERIAGYYAGIAEDP